MNGVERVKAICKERKIPFSKLEKDLGYGNGYIGQLRRGVFPSDRLVEIADYLGVTTEYILTGENEKSAPTAFGESAIYCDIKLTKAERELIQKFRQLDQRGQSSVLNTLEHEYAALPGEKAPPAAKNA